MASHDIWGSSPWLSGQNYKKVGDRSSNSKHKLKSVFPVISPSFGDLTTTWDPNLFDLLLSLRIPGIFGYSVQEGSHNFWIFYGMFHEFSPFFNGTILKFVQSASFWVMMDFWLQLSF